MNLNETKKVRVLIADDSPTVRLMLCRMLEMDSGIKVVGTASDGREAVEQVAALEPDLVTMDVNMPIMDGLAAIEHIMAYNPVPVLVVSSVVGRDNTANAARALGAGAVDVICKPAPKTLDEFNNVAADLRAKIKLLSRVRVITHPRARLLNKIIKPVEIRTTSGAVEEHKIVAIGSSTGGPQALQRILCSLPADFTARVVIVQHIARGFTDGLIEWLSSSCKMDIIKGSDGHLLEPGEVVIAPDGIHMIVTTSGRIQLVERQIPGPHKPSIDVLLESVADVYGKKAVGVILTGMGRDGAQGIKAIHDRGGHTIAQDKNTSVIFSMAKEAIKLGGVDRVVPLSAVGRLLLEFS
ncbi:MAG: chemotaxis-specific protein-glutamate methyltransferase CheB [Actinobacteria bacterium]|nr:chemotaxis-specific protein-glutamate methyltransferase CheB [Actinomycetota bacterium]